jgi:hypothetical protein
MPTETWTCHAVPALTGKPCGHVNERGLVFHGEIMCCEACGSTKRASDARKEQKENGQ